MNSMFFPNRYPIQLRFYYPVPIAAPITISRATIRPVYQFYPSVNLPTAIHSVVKPKAPVQLGPKEIRDLLITNARKEQQTLLQYVSDAELQAIYSLFNHPLQNVVVRLITDGSWEQLIQEFKTNKSVHFHSLLKAAYCQNKISLLELVTAYIFLAPAAAGHSWKIYTHEEVFEKLARRVNSLFLDSCLDRWENITEIPENLRYFVAIHVPDNTDQDAYILRSLMQGQRDVCDIAGGLRLDDSASDDFAMGSAPYIIHDRLSKGLTPAFIRGLTPERKDLIERFSEGYSDYGILDPGEEANIHTGSSASLLPYAHDSFHLVVRVYSGLLQKRGVLQKSLEMEEIVKSLPPYSRPTIVDSTTKIYPKLSALATYDDVIRFIFDRTLSTIADGELTANGPDFAIIDSQILTYVKATAHGMIDIEDLTNRLNPHLVKLGLPSIKISEFLGIV